MPPAPRDLLFLDACCVINLAASGRMEEILASLSYECAVAAYVEEREALGLAVAADLPDERTRIDLSPLIGSGRLTIWGLEAAEEQRELVRFALELDEGEAQTCALAVVHGGAVATDDRKALKVLARERIRSAQSPELLYEWAGKTAASAAEVAEVVGRILERARFVPRREAPRGEWWISHLGMAPRG